MTRHDRDLNLNHPGALIAAIPAVLGFTPEKSLVLVAVDDGQMGAVLRVDLSPELSDGLHDLIEVMDAEQPDAVIAVVVDAKGAACPMCNEEHRALCDVLTAALSDRCIEVWAAHIVDYVGAGGQWHCVDGCGARGRVDDPKASPAAVAAVLNGRRLYATRADLQAVIAAGDTTGSAALGAPAIRARLVDDEVRRNQDPDGCARRHVQAALTAADRVATGAPLADADIAALGCALVDAQVRDTMYAVAVGERAGAAEALWAALARRLPAPWRVEPLVLLAFSAYARGDGPLAGVALEEAFRCDPKHRMARMLDDALHSAMRPEQIRELALTGYHRAEQLGVRLPPRQPFNQRAM
ncbi:DUF4192 domain-containing protein [soil metagenome]